MSRRRPRPFRGTRVTRHLKEPVPFGGSYGERSRHPQETPMSERHEHTVDERMDFATEAAESLREDKPERAMARLAGLLLAAIGEGENRETLRGLCHALERAMIRARLTMSDGNPRGWTG